MDNNIRVLQSSMTVVERLNRRNATLKAMLEDTADFLERLVGVNPTEERDAQAQAEAIRQVLTDEPKRG